MTTNRFLPLLNLVGCFAITGVIFAQWIKERGLQQQIGRVSTELVVSRGQTTEAEKRAAALEGDVAQLKESIEATAKARREAEEAAEKIATEHNAKMAEVATAGQDQVKTWETAIAERDAKIRELNAALVAARERLNGAIAKLREAGAR